MSNIEKQLQEWLEKNPVTPRQKWILENEIKNGNTVNIEWLITNKRSLEVILRVINNERIEHKRAIKYFQNKLKLK